MASGTGLSDKQRLAVETARYRYELVTLLTAGVVTRVTLRARLQELDDLDRRFSAKHPIVFVVWLLFSLALGVLFFGSYESSGHWAILFYATFLFVYSIANLLSFALLRKPRRRERAMIEALLFNEQVLPREM